MNSTIGTLLIVDDNQLITLNQANILEDLNYLCLTAENIKKAWNLLNTRKFGLILCDHDLPDGKGTVFIEKISEAGINIPILYISAAVPSILEEVRNFPNVKDVLIKPASEESLIKAVNKHFLQSEEKLFPRLIGFDERNSILEKLLT